MGKRRWEATACMGQFCFIAGLYHAIGVREYGCCCLDDHECRRRQSGPRSAAWSGSGDEASRRSSVARRRRRRTAPAAGDCSTRVRGGGRGSERGGCRRPARGRPRHPPFVVGKFVIHAQAAGLRMSAAVDDDCIAEAAAARETGGLQPFDFIDMGKGAGRGDFVAEPVGRQAEGGRTVGRSRTRRIRSTDPSAARARPHTRLPPAAAARPRLRRR